MSKMNRQKRFNRNIGSIPLKYKIGGVSLALAVAVGIALPSTASETLKETTTPVDSIEEKILAINKEASECADPTNVNGLANAQMNTIQDMQKLILTPINTDSMFDIAKQGGCFNALSNFPDLSMTIPSLTGIATSLQKSLIDYATRKVCTAVNDSLTEMLEPVNELMAKVSENGELDLTGMVNKEVNKQIYQIDPDIGKVKAPSALEYQVNVGDMTSKTAVYNPDGSTTITNSNTGATATTPTPNTASMAQPETQSQSSVLSYTQADNKGSSTSSSGSSVADFFRKIF